MATVKEVLQRALAVDSPVQTLPECVLGAKAVKQRKGVPPHVRVEFATTHMRVDDLLYFSGELGRPKSRRPQYVGLVVWMPFEEYDAATREEPKVNA